MVRKGSSVRVRQSALRKCLHIGGLLARRANPRGGPPAHGNLLEASSEAWLSYSLSGHRTSHRGSRRQTIDGRRSRWPRCARPEGPANEPDEALDDAIREGGHSCAVDGAESGAARPRSCWLFCVSVSQVAGGARSCANGSARGGTDGLHPHERLVAMRSPRACRSQPSQSWHRGRPSAAPPFDDRAVGGHGAGIPTTPQVAARQSRNSKRHEDKCRCP
jgi:hypothetical protein